MDTLTDTPMDIKPPLRLRKWFNWLMIFINIAATILFLVVLPMIAGWQGFGRGLAEHSNLLVSIFHTWIVGLIFVSAVIVSALYFFLTVDTTVRSILRNWRIIRSKKA